jgi:PEP-CTERM motif-containing protein
MTLQSARLLLYESRWINAAICQEGSKMNLCAKEASGQVARNGRHALQHIGAMVAAIGFAVALSGPARADNIVANGSFETGDFTGWTTGGNFGFSGVECPGAPFAGPGDGNCDGFFGPVGSNGTLSQTLNTIAGGRYFITFDFQPDGGNPSFFSASFGPTLLTSLTNPAASPYQVLHFVGIAAGPTTAISFAFRDDPGFLKLDSVSVSLPEPGTLALLGMGMIGLWLRRRKEQ